MHRRHLLWLVSLSLGASSCQQTPTPPPTPDRTIPPDVLHSMVKEVVDEQYRTFLKPIVDSGAYSSVNVLPMPVAYRMQADETAAWVASELHTRWSTLPDFFALDAKHQRRVLRLLRERKHAVDEKDPNSYVDPMVELAATEEFQRSESFFQFLAVPQLLALQNTLRLEIKLVHMQTGRSHVVSTTRHVSGLIEANRVHSIPREF